MAKKSAEEQNEALRTYVKMLEDQIERFERLVESKDRHIESLKNLNDYMREAIEIRDSQVLMLQETLKKVTDEGMKVALAAIPNEFFKEA